MIIKFVIYFLYNHMMKPGNFLGSIKFIVGNKILNCYKKIIQFNYLVYLFLPQRTPRL